MLLCLTAFKDTSFSKINRTAAFEVSQIQLKRFIKMLMQMAIFNVWSLLIFNTQNVKCKNFFDKEHISLVFSDLCWNIHDWNAYDLNYTIYKQKRILVSKLPPTNFHKNYYHHLDCIFITLFSKGILEILEICKIIWLHKKDTSCAILKGIYSSQQHTFCPDKEHWTFYSLKLCSGLI